MVRDLKKLSGSRSLFREAVLVGVKKAACRQVRGQRVSHDAFHEETCDRALSDRTVIVDRVAIPFFEYRGEK